MEINVYLPYEHGKSYQSSFTAYPRKQARRPKALIATPDEIAAAYGEACLLYGVHVGSAGAYTRRALEILLDTAGYAASTLAGSITLAKNEADYDKRLPRHLLQKLDYVKEVGNFALHVRRDDELAIVTIDRVEVAACLDALENLIDFWFEARAAEFIRTLAMNKKLVAASKKEHPLPDLPLGMALERMMELAEPLKVEGAAP